MDSYDSSSKENDSTCTLDSGLSDSSPIPYYVWSTWTPEEVVNWATSQATLIQYVKPVFNWFGIDGKYLQLLMSRDNDFFWRETRLSEEQKTFICKELCRLLGPPMDTPPPTAPNPSLTTSTPPPRKKVTFSDEVLSKEYIPEREEYNFHGSPDLSSRDLQKKVYLVKVASRMRVDLQHYHLHGRRFGLTSREIDNYVLQHSFEGLGNTIKDIVDNAQTDVKQPLKPQFNETEKSLIAAFKGTWKKVAFKDGAPLQVIYAWFNKALLKSGMSGWSQEGKRWTYLQYKLGLSDGSAGWVPLHSSPYSNDSPVRSVHSPFRGISPVLHLANV